MEKLLKYSIAIDQNEHPSIKKSIESQQTFLKTPFRESSGNFLDGIIVVEKRYKNAKLSSINVTPIQ